MINIMKDQMYHTILPDSKLNFAKIIISDLAGNNFVFYNCEAIYEKFENLFDKAYNYIADVQRKEDYIKQCSSTDNYFTTDCDELVDLCCELQTVIPFADGKDLKIIKQFLRPISNDLSK
jgi:hypothetical protein